MRNRQPGKWIILVGPVLLMLAPAARANACVDTGALGIIAAAALLTPGDIGVALPVAEASTARLVVGWSWQIPVSLGENPHPMRHRIVPAVDLLPHPDGVSWRGRLGYRYGRRHLFAGAGAGVDGAGPNLSPELGVKFAHHNSGDDDFDLSLHLLARAEIAPESGRVRGATVLLGWNIF